jgi:hypothetical protein
MIPGAARTAGCETTWVLQRNIYGLINQVFSPGRNSSPTRTVGGITTCEGMTLGHALTKSQSQRVCLFNSKYFSSNFQILLYYNHKL